VEDRAVPGHWEGDLLSGPNNTYIATLVERQTRYVMLAKVAGKDSRTVVNALIKQSKKLPKELYRSLTWDRGKELTDHRRFTMATNIDVYFCDPQSPWQRGSNDQWPAETVLSQGYRLVGAFASPSEQSGSSAKRTTTRDLAI
jgi:IS30 family transposase